MSQALRSARILSSEADSSVTVKQNQTNNINISLKEAASPRSFLRGTQEEDGVTRPTDCLPPPYPSVQVQYPPSNFQEAENSVLYQPAPVPMSEVASRDIDLTAHLSDKEKQIEILELLLEIYENNPLIINRVVICKSSQLMHLIKLITDAEKVELLMDDDKNCTCGKTTYRAIGSIFVTKDGKSVDFKYGFNDKYTLLMKHAISLKICV